MTKVCYLASPYSHEYKAVRDAREVTVTRVAAFLTEKLGHAFILPITQSAAMARINPEMSTNFDAWREIDLELIRRSDELWVVTMNGWDRSKGVKEEMRFAYEINKPIYFINPDCIDRRQDVYSVRDRFKS